MTEAEAPEGVAANNSILGAEVVEVSWRDLKVHPKNPRKGNVDAIAESLKVNGQFRPLIVQKSTNFIIGGNHTFLGTRKLRWRTVQVVFLDVTDEQAEKIMLADNRTSDLGTYDTDALAAILKGIVDPTGTGYSDSDTRAILAAIEDEDTDLLVETVRPTPQVVFSGEEAAIPFDERVKELQKTYDARIGDRLREELEMSPEEEAAFQQNVSVAQIQNELEQMSEAIFPTDANYWGVPELRRDMLIDSIPDPIATWGGPDATEDDGVSTYLWNFGLASSKNLPWDRAMMCMFTYDTKFKQWWETPAFQAAKVIHNGLTMGIVPDTSMWTEEPRFRHLEAVYKAQWVARFLQEAGVRMMPRLMWCDPESIKIGMLGIPPKPPVVAVCLQAASEEEFNAGMSANGLREFIKVVQPEALLVYSGNPGRQVVEDAHLPKSLHVVCVDNYAAVRRHTAYDRTTGKSAVEKRINAEQRLERHEKKLTAQEEKEKRAAERAAAKAQREAEAASRPKRTRKPKEPAEQTEDQPIDS